MAEDGVGFDPLESLGNDYGKINDEGLDTKSFQPFEGSRIKPNEINFGASERFYPVFPAMESLDKPTRQVKNAVASTLTNTPNKQNIKKTTSTKDILKAFGDQAIAKVEASQSYDEVAKIYAYDASPSGNAFYKRYAAYGQEKFDQIGFHPLRDNEANFNARTSKWDDWSRMMTHSFWPLFGQGFKSAPKSMAKLATLDFSSDTQDASEYEEAAAIGQSSKGGAFGFINNTALNFGYTAGIITEAVAEELVGAVLAAPTGGASLFAATANNAKKLFNIGKGIDKAVDGLKAVNQTINSVNSINAARKIWESIKIGKILNPLDNTMDAISAIKKTDNISNLAKLSKTAGGFYRDVRNVNMALAEGRLEAGMVQNHVYDKLYNKFYDENGEAPSNQEQQYMIQQAKEASANTLFWNTGLIFLSNKITFDNITGPRGGLRNFMKSTVNDVVSVGGGKFGTIGKVVYDKTKKAFEFEKNNMMNLAKSWWKSPGYKTAAKTIGYMKGNFSEGIQENLQEVIAGANERYYVDTFKSKGRRSHEYAKGVLNLNKGEYFSEELGKQFSAQGFETFASGFVMGMPAGVLNKAMPFLFTSYNRIFNKDGYQEYKANKLKITEGIVNSLNNININDFLKSAAFNYGAQDIISDIKQKGSKKEALDAELEGIVTAMQTMVETNTTDVFIDKLRSYGDMNDAEFMDAMSLTDKEEISKYRERVNTSISKIEKIKKRYEFYNDKFVNPVKPEDLEGLDETSDEYQNAVSLYHGWNQAVKNAVFFNESFEDNMNRMLAIQTKFLNNTLLKNTGQREMNIIFQPNKLTGEIELLTNEIKSLTDLKDISEASKKELKSKKLALKTLQEFKTKHDAFELFYNRSDYFKIVKKQLSEQLGRDALDEEVNMALEKELGSMDDETLQVKYTTELKTAFNEYIKNIANTEDTNVFDSNLDESFKMLLDYYKLGVEGKHMTEYINLLHDPNNFSDLARRNQAWMKKLYNTRPEYYEKMVVKPELKNVEDNALLNRLASRNIFISEEALIQWREEGIIPTEFFDNTNKKVIPKGTQEYNRQIALFNFANELQETEDISNKIYTGELKTKLDNLTAKETAEIDALPKVEVKVDSRKIKLNFKKSFTINTINDNIKDKEFADVEHEVNKELVKLTLYKDGDILKLNNADGEEINLKDYDFKYKSGNIYKINLEANPSDVDTIKARYVELKKTAIKESKAKPVEFTPITKDTPINEYDENLQNALFIKFDELTSADPELYADILADEELYDQAFMNYIQTNPEAIKLVDEYNKSKSGKTIVPDVVEQVIPETKLTPEQQEELQNTIQEIISNKDFIKLSDDGLNYVNSKTGKVYTRVTNYISEDEFKDGIKKDESIDDYTKRLLSLNYTEAEARQKLLLASSQIIGTKVDTLVRDFFTGEVKDLSEYDLSSVENITEFLNNLANIKTIMDARGEKVLANDIVLYNDELAIAGTVDLLTYDNNGNIRIYDMKTMRGNNLVTSYKDETINKYESTRYGGKSKKEKHTEQLSIYRILLNNTHNLKAMTIAIMPIEIAYQPGDTTTTKLNLIGGIKLEPLDKVKDAELITRKILRKEFKQTPTEIDPRITKIEERRKGKDDRNKYPGIKELISIYTGGKLYFGINDSGFEIIQSLKANNVTADDIFNIRNTISGKIADWFERGFKQLSGKTFEEYDAELATLEGQKEILSEDNTFNKNDTLIAKKDIIIENANGTNTIFAGENDTVIISSINTKNGTVKLRLMGKRGVETFNITELDNLFTLSNIVMSETVIETRTFNPTNQEKTIITESSGNVEDFMDPANAAKLKEIESNADKLSNSELDDELLNDLDCR